MFIGRKADIFAKSIQVLIILHTRTQPLSVHRAYFSQNASQTRTKHVKNTREFPCSTGLKTQSRVFEGIQRQKAQPMAILAKSCACLFSPQFP